MLTPARQGLLGAATVGDWMRCCEILEFSTGLDLCPDLSHFPCVQEIRDLARFSRDVGYHSSASASPKLLPAHVQGQGLVESPYIQCRLKHPQLTARIGIRDWRRRRTSSAHRGSRC